MNLAELKSPFTDEQIRWRIGATTERDGKTFGLALAYIDARELYDRLDEVCEPQNWQLDYPQANGKTTCRIGIKIDGEWIWKSNGCGDTDVEAAKGAYSDAAKRAGVPWGIASYLYDMENVWVECEKRGRSVVIKQDQYSKLVKAHNNLVRNLKPQLTPEQEKIKNFILGVKAEIDKAPEPEDVTHVIHQRVSEINKLTPAQQKHINTYAANRRSFLTQQPIAAE